MTATREWTNVDPVLLQVNDKLRHINVRRELVRRALVSLPKPAVRGRGKVDDLRDLRAQLRSDVWGHWRAHQRALQSTLHECELRLGVLDGRVLLRQVHDGCVLAVDVLHLVSVLVAYPLDPEWAAPGYADVKDEVVAVGRRRRGRHSRRRWGISRTRRRWRTTVESGNRVQYGFVGDGDLLSGDMDLLGTTEALLHLVGDDRCLISREDEVLRRIDVEDGVVERLHSEP